MAVAATSQGQVRVSQFSGAEQRTFEEMIAVGEAASALAQLDSRIAQITEARGRDTDEIVGPLILKGNALHELGYYDAALNTYDDARAIRRRHHGLHDLQQVGILYSEAETYYAQKQYHAANDRYEYAFSLYRRNYGSESPAILPGLYRLADWYMDTHNFFTARGLYELALDKWADDDSIDPQSRAKALSSLADTYRYEAFPPTGFTWKTEKFTPRPYGSINHPEQYYAELNDYVKGEEALLELVKMYMAREPQTSLTLADAKLQLGDWYLLFEQYKKANIVYGDIWHTLSGTDQFSFVEENMMSPHAIHAPLPNGPDQPDEDSTRIYTEQEGKIEFELTVTEKGLTKNIRKISSFPGNMLTRETKQAIEDSLYRPKFVDGVAVATEQVPFSHTFSYYRSERRPAAKRTPNTSNATSHQAN
ncbi:MAG: hypothetical protein F4W90_03575 [Gammaproteobacteria bacterium]|nr:hypothetical protein [Gammaproteobacteria bacterium]